MARAGSPRLHASSSRSLSYASASEAWFDAACSEVAISDHRLVALSEDAVTFKTKGEGRASVAPEEFIRRFLLHVLPDGFHKIRHLGLYSGTAVRERLPAAAAALGKPRAATEPEATAPEVEDVVRDLRGLDLGRCPCCESGRMLRFPVSPQPRQRPPRLMDTS